MGQTPKMALLRPGPGQARPEPGSNSSLLHVLLHRDHIKEQRYKVPTFTKTGVKKKKMPKELHSYILERRNSSDIVYESCLRDNALYPCKLLGNELVIDKMKLLRFVGNDTEVRKKIMNALKPIVEKWSGQKLSSDGICYGIRQYTDGAQLLLHVDRLPTHIFSVILQVYFFCFGYLFIGMLGVIT